MVNLDTTVEQLSRLGLKDLTSSFERDASLRLNDFVPYFGFGKYDARIEKYFVPPLISKFSCTTPNIDFTSREVLLLFYNFTVFGAAAILGMKFLKYFR